MLPMGWDCWSMRQRVDYLAEGMQHFAQQLDQVRDNAAQANRKADRAESVATETAATLDQTRQLGEQVLQHVKATGADIANLAAELQADGQTMHAAVVEYIIRPGSAVTIGRVTVRAVN